MSVPTLQRPAGEDVCQMIRHHALLLKEGKHLAPALQLSFFPEVQHVHLLQVQQSKVLQVDR